ncbi:uncharacterized protein LOC131938535 [Physella acuta]|uniref:uncharacterized protein LOC131938535 n=1 Tax=Physella acuta TaxID=109671 RepID=UPI0027DB563E|nr:uncharacterized protein LOC131938535 [Physella acuta]
MSKKASKTTAGGHGSTSSYKSVLDIQHKYDQAYDEEVRYRLNTNEAGPVYNEGLGGVSVSTLNQIWNEYTQRTSTDVDSKPSTGLASLFSDSSNVFNKYRSKEEISNDVKEALCDFIFKNVVGFDFIYRGPFGRNIITYLDYVASGRPLKCIETYIRYHVMPTYANTHTEVHYNAAQTTKLREEARGIIRESVKAGNDDAVIFCGSGSTAAIHKIIHAMGLKRTVTSMLGPTVFVGPYEHHSNILPWLEIRANVIRIGQTSEGLTDLEHLKSELVKCRCGPERVLIGSFSAASNVTGILTDTIALANLMHQFKGFCFFDYACAGPYVDIDMNCLDKGEMAYKDAVFISPHKFVGGPQTPGVLVAKRWMFKNKVPHDVGGGTVVFVRRQGHTYYEDAEVREEGGTPAIIESIRAGLVFKLKDTLTTKFIMAKEMEMMELAIKAWADHPDIIILGNLQSDRLPIFSMLFLNRVTGRLLHHDFIAMVLNDLFGIQVRSGCACAAPYGLDLIGMTEQMATRYHQFVTNPPPDKTPNYAKKAKSKPLPEDLEGVQWEGDTTDNIIFKPGFVRLNFPYFISHECFDFVIKAIILTAENAWVLLPLYDFDRKTGKWWYRGEENCKPAKSLKDVSFKKGKLDVEAPPRKPTNITKFDLGRREVSSADSLQSEGNDFKGFHYEEILQRAKKIFEQANKPGVFDLPDQTFEYTAEAEELRWFMLPSEAADIVNNREVIHRPPEEYPFIPGRPASELHKSKDNRWRWWLCIVITIVVLALTIFFLVWVHIKGDDDEEGASNSNAENAAAPAENIYSPSNSSTQTNSTNSTDITTNTTAMPNQ